jgi:hypothetical protein
MISKTEGNPESDDSNRRFVFGEQIDPDGGVTADDVEFINEVLDAMAADDQDTLSTEEFERLIAEVEAKSSKPD